MRDSYKRFIKTWIRFANPWIRIDSQVTNPDLKRFVSYRGSQILTLKDSFRIVITNPVNFRKIRPVFTNPTNPYESLRILTNPYESLRILTNPYESLVLWHLRILKFWIRESGFANPNLKDSYRGFDSQTFFQKIRIVDLFRKTKNLKRFDSFRFVRIRVRIPHPY